MTHPVIQAYLAAFQRELRKRGVVQHAIIDESRDHLVDAMEARMNDGHTADEAARDAVNRFGEPAHIAGRFAADRRRRRATLLVCASIIGMLIAHVDSLPSWDDTGITAGALLVAAGLFGALAPDLPWLWALAVGMWIPVHAITHHPTLGSAAMIVVLAFPLAGAYAGMAVRKAFA